MERTVWWLAEAQAFTIGMVAPRLCGLQPRTLRLRAARRQRTAVVTRFLETMDMKLPVPLRALLFTVVVPGTIAGLLPWALQSRGSASLTWMAPLTRLGAARHVGWLPLVAGAIGYLLCVRDFVVRGRGTPSPLDPPVHFVATGLYRRVRNPMYVSIGLVLLGETLLWQAPVLLLYLAALGVTVHAFVVLYEEPHLGRTFGDEYARYVASVPRWIARSRPVSATASSPACTPDLSAPDAHGVGHAPTKPISAIHSPCHPSEFRP